MATDPGEWACQCLNIRLRLLDHSALAPNGIQVAFPTLTARETITLPGKDAAVACTRCLNCNSIPYAAAKPAPPGPARSYGFNTESPSRDVNGRADRPASKEGRPYEPFVRPLDGQITLLPDALSPQQAEEVQRTDPNYSPAFRILIKPSSDTPSDQADRMDATPTRPQAGKRRSSISQLPGASSYTLPAVPSHLITSPPQSPRPGGSGISASVTTSSSLLSTGFGNPLAAMLDSAAMERLRDFRSKAEAEIFELVRQKRREMEALEKRTKEEAEALLEISRARSHEAAAAAGLKATRPAEGARGRGRTIAAAEGAASKPMPVAAPAIKAEPADYHEPQDMDLPPSAFERRSNQMTRPELRPTMSTSLSALSASFAMRGRDPPQQLEDWAEKRRLRERYPEGDHSALPSAVNSDDEDEERKLRSREMSNNSLNTDEEAELDQRGRGRGPQRLDGFNMSRQDSAQTIQAAEPSRGRGRGTAAPPSFSLSKAPAVAQIDDGKNADQDTPQVGGRLISPQSAPEPSAEVLLRPRNPPPSNTEPLKPAQKKLKTRKSAEKKVAFAEAEDKVQHSRPVSDEEDEADEEAEEERVLLDETDAAVFDLDDEAETAEEEGDESMHDKETKIEHDPEQPTERAIRRGASGRIRGQGDDSFPGLEEDDDEEPDSEGLTTEDDVMDPPGTGAASFSYIATSADSPHDAYGSHKFSIPGSFSNMAATHSAMKQLMSNQYARADDSGFDPASIRLDGRVVPEPSAGVNGGSPQQTLSRGRDDSPSTGRRSGSRSRMAKKGVVDTEVRLSGLLAPNAPSHRGLWSNQAKKGGKYKYQLDEQDDQKWAAWQRKVKEAEDKAGEDDSGLGRSVPMNVAPPERFLALGARPNKEPSPAESFESGNSRAITMSRPSYRLGTSITDRDSGFEREPKTSLPYKERMMVPSLRKAIRRSMFEETKPTLETIPDEALPPATTVVRPTPVSAAQGATSSNLSGSLVTRGFTLPSAAASAPVAPVAHAAVAAMKEVAVGTTSGSSTPNSFGRRSPRPPYIPPPPPVSYDLVLEADPANAPKALKVFEVEADKSFSLYEDGEEPETEEGWEKVLLFLHRLERLKINKRTGWLHHRVAKPESIADHMYRMGLLALLCPSEPSVDIGKCVQLALVHDLAEAEVGDLTPLDKVPKEEKARREHEAIQYFAHDLLGSSAAGLRIEALWNEYEERQTKESKLVKDLDRFELCLQAVEFERSDGINDLQGFFEGSLPQIRHPRIRRWAKTLAEERRRMWLERGVVFEQTYDDDDE